MPPHVLTGGRLQSVLRLLSLQKSRRPTTWFPYSAEADDDGHLGRTIPRLEVTRIFLPLPSPHWESNLPRPGHKKVPRSTGPGGGHLFMPRSFAIEHHRVYEKKSKFRSCGSGRRQALCGFRAGSLGEAGSGRMPEPFWITCGPFVASLYILLRFRALTSVISAKHNAQMALRWVRYLRRPI